MKKVQIDTVSDIIFPWCYIGRKRLENALKHFDENLFEITWRSFELFPKYLWTVFENVARFLSLTRSSI